MGDTDVTHAPLRVPSDPLTVVVSAKGAEVAGTLPRDGLPVVLWPETENRGHPLRGVRLVQSTKGGSFLLRGLAPGVYRLAAFDADQPGILWNYGFLDKFADGAIKVEVNEGTRIEVNPPVVSRDRFYEEFAKLPE